MRPYKKMSNRGPFKKHTGNKRARRRPEEYYVPGNGMAIKVLDGNIEIALKKFKKLVKESGILFDLKERREFIKPSAVNRKKMQHARRRQYHISVEELRERLY